jgi:acetyl-CoA synthetase
MKKSVFSAVGYVFMLNLFCLSSCNNQIADNANNTPIQRQEIIDFWAEHAAKLPWFERWHTTLTMQGTHARWFEGGTINAAHACLDVHLTDKYKDKIAIYWADEQGHTLNLTYEQLYHMVNDMAVALRSIGVAKGDIVTIYMPLIPQAVAAMLAVARLGAVHAVVFSGFGSQALQERLNDTKAKFVITAASGLRRGKVLNIKAAVDAALGNAPLVQKVVVVKQDRDKEIAMQSGRDVWLHDIMPTQPTVVTPEPVDANDPLFILYTSGSTGKPKGIVHATGGYLTYAYWTFAWTFNPQEDSVYWCTADIGWITGHTYAVYAPLMHGVSMVLYEGAPDYPNPDAWWKVIKTYNVTHFYTSPTALALLRTYGDQWLASDNLKGLQVLGTVGEPISPEVWQWYNQQVGGGRCPIIDTWWQTETGGFMIAPTPALKKIVLKPGSVTLPLPMIDADIVDADGRPVEPEIKGFLVIKQPWPGMMARVFNDANDDVYNRYWKRFNGMYYSGDWAVRGTDGYFRILGRADEVLKVSGHRIGTAELESAALTHKAVAQVAAIGVHDDIKGEAIVLFVVLKAAPYEALASEVKQTVRNAIGAFATPRDVIVVKSLPRTRSGKIMRRVLKALYEGMPIGDITTLEDGVAVDEAVAAMHVVQEIAAQVCRPKPQPDVLSEKSHKNTQK